MKQAPQLGTDRLNMRAFRPDDDLRMLAILSAKDILRYFPASETMSLTRVRELIQKVTVHWETNGYGLWAVESLETGELIGRCGLQHLWETDEVEIDFIMAPEVWGRGFATEAAKASLMFGFEQLDLCRIIGLVHPDNAASQKVLENIGMTFDVRTEYFGMRVDRFGADSANPALGE